MGCDEMEMMSSSMISRGRTSFVDALLLRATSNVVFFPVFVYSRACCLLCLRRCAHNNQGRYEQRFS
jgi:hypothetical protein